MAGSSQPSLAFVVFGLVGQTFVFGLYSLLVTLSTRLLLRRHQRNTTKTFLISLTSTMYLLSTLYWIYSLALVSERLTVVKEAVDILSGVGGTSTIASLSNDTIISWSPVLNAVILLNYVLADAVLVWRAWIAGQSGSRRFLFAPIGFLVLTTIALTVLIILRFVVFMQGAHPSIPSSVGDAFQATMLGLSLATNLGALVVVAGAGSVDISNSVVVKSSSAFILVTTVLLITTLIPSSNGPIGDFFLPIAAQFAGAFPSALLLLIESSGFSDRASIGEKIQITFPSPTNGEFKSRDIADNEYKPRPMVPARVDVDLNIDNLKASDFNKDPEANRYVAPPAPVVVMPQQQTTPAPSLRNMRTGISSTEFALPKPQARPDDLEANNNTLAPAPVSLNSSPSMKKARLNVMSTEFSMPPAPQRTKSRLELSSQPRKQVSLDDASSSTESTPAMVAIALPEPAEAVSPPEIVVAEPSINEPLSGPFDGATSLQHKPSRVPIAAGALNYYQRRQQMGMMQAAQTSVPNSRPSSQSSVVSLKVTAPPPGLSIGTGGGMVVMAQGRDHPFPLRSQRFAAPPKTPTTPRTMMMTDTRDQAALDALDLDLELVLGSLEQRALEDSEATPLSTPMVMPVVEPMNAPERFSSLTLGGMSDVPTDVMDDSTSDAGEPAPMDVSEDAQNDEEGGYAIYLNDEASDAGEPTPIAVPDESRNDAGYAVYLNDSASDAGQPTPMSAQNDDDDVGYAFYLDEYDLGDEDNQTPVQSRRNVLPESQLIDFALPAMPTSAPPSPLAASPIVEEQEMVTPIEDSEPEYVEQDVVEPEYVEPEFFEPEVFELEIVEPMVPVLSPVAPATPVQMVELMPSPMFASPMPSPYPESEQEAAQEELLAAIESMAPPVAAVEEELGPAFEAKPAPRSSLAVAKMTTFPTVPRSRSPNASRAGTPTPSIISSISTEAPSRPEEQAQAAQETQTHQRSRSQSHARKMNQFPVASLRGSPDSSRAPTPVQSSPLDDEPRASPARAAPKPNGLTTATPPSRTGTPTPSIASSSPVSEPIVHQPPGSHQRSKSLRMNQFPVRAKAPAPPAGPSISVEDTDANEAPRAIIGQEPPKQQPAPAKLVKKQPKLALLEEPAVKISGPLSPRVLESSDEVAIRKALNRFSDG